MPSEICTDPILCLSIYVSSGRIISSWLSPSHSWSKAFLRRREHYPSVIGGHPASSQTVSGRIRCYLSPPPWENIPGQAARDGWKMKLGRGCRLVALVDLAIL